MKENKFDFSLQPGRMRKRDLCREKIKPYVSIITPYYNGSRYFAQTFRCVADQTFPWFEWVIVDDGSSPKESRYLRKYAQQDARIRVYTKKNGGPAHARNYAIDRTNTDFIVSLDADDLIAPAYLETAYWALQFHPDAGWAYTDCLGFGSENYTWKVPFDSQVLKKRNFLIEVAMIRKQALLAAGKYDDRERYSYEDWRLWLQLLAAGYYPVHLGGYSAWYRRTNHGSLSVTADNRSNRRRAERKIKEAADLIRQPVEAAEYPVSRTAVPYYRPKPADFAETDSRGSGGIHMLFLIPQMPAGGAGTVYLELAWHMRKKGIELSIMTTVPSQNDGHQKFERCTDQIFHLPDFLDPAYYLDFLGYYIKAKRVDAVLTADSREGYFMMPWLRKYFPQIVIMDYVRVEERYKTAGGYAEASAMMDEWIDRTFVGSSAAKDAVVRKFGKDKEHVQVFRDKAGAGRPGCVLCPAADDAAVKRHEKMSQMLKSQGDFAEAFYAFHLAAEGHEAGDGPCGRLPGRMGWAYLKRLGKRLVKRIERKCHREDLWAGR